MTVSKRTRYEVLRRDDHTCRYCGGRAPDVALTVGRAECDLRAPEQLVVGQAGVEEAQHGVANNTLAKLHDRARQLLDEEGG